MENLLFGVIAGIGAALGLGGGTILILLLNFFTDIKQYEIQGINLVFFIPASIIAIYVNYKNKLIDFKIAKKCIFIGIFGLIGFLIGTFKVPESNAFSITKKTGGENIDEVIKRYIEFKLQKNKIYVYQDTKRNVEEGTKDE